MQSCNLYHYFSDHFSSFSFRKLSLLLECSRCLIHRLALLPRTLPLTLLVYNNARGTLGNSFAIVTLVGHSFHVSSITFLVDSHVCSQRNSSVLPKRPREHMTGSSPLSFCICHFGKLLEDDSSGPRCNSLLTHPVVFDESRYFVLDAGYEYNFSFLLYSGSQTLVDF